LTLFPACTVPVLAWMDPASGITSISVPISGSVSD
jgi:hypothetical protein